MYKFIKIYHKIYRSYSFILTYYCQDCCRIELNVSVFETCPL